MTAGGVNLGPPSSDMLAQVGITSPGLLDELGPVRAYVRCVLGVPGVSEDLLYGLLGNELDMHSNDLPGNIKAASLLEAQSRLRSHSEGLLHIVPEAEWATSGRPYSPESLETDGFIHCSTRHTVLGPADALYAGTPGLVLLDIDPDLVATAIIFEDSYGAGTEFPHIYGPLSTSCVTRTVGFPCRPDGTFTLPADLA